MENFWKNINEAKPRCTEVGDWDGKRSERVLFYDDNGMYFVGDCYEGFMDSSYFFDTYDENGFYIENVKYWAYVPSLF